MAPLPKLMWFREHEPETFAAVARWGGLKELVLERLTGTWAIDHSCASGTGLMALDDLDWDAEALDLAGVGADRLGRLVPVTERFELIRRGGRGRPASTPGCRSSPAAATGRSRTSGSARSTPASRRARSGRAARCG